MPQVSLLRPGFQAQSDKVNWPPTLNSGFGTAIALTTLAVVSLCGLLVGFIVSLLFRLPWTPGVAGWDAVLSVVAGIVYAFIFVAIAKLRDHFDPGSKWLFITAVTGAFVRHLTRFRQHKKLSIPE